MKTTLYIQNLKCGGCANTITKNVSSIDAVTEVSVNVEENSVSFDYPTEEKLIEVKEKLKVLGYPEDGEANSLGAKAKSYVSCAIGKMS
ncbi:heavy-metal-associated domain-containing protein [Flavobacterium sp. UBA7663]|uniref:heavy-metal-associated domain-containing protein n=1 Tax=Flavobacterium sp. UBA7663 TaxID=1946557 RepID=UPI0025C1E9EE|nr:heavy-metal-associated domain-containing protein [Flavobacterium sp. UBA7663]